MDPAKRLKMIGARILSEANDLKRTPTALASQLGLKPSLVDAVIHGNCSLQDARSLVFSMSEILPVAIADLWVDEDYAVEGAHVMTAAQSVASARIFERAERHGKTSPYYEYRDTAMLRGGPFRPEWIRILRAVDDNDPNNPDVIFNNGHLLHQITVFSGAVNFYWEEGGERHCRTMSDGGSNFIPPFVPHSFATRNGEQPGLIIAATFAGEMRRNINELQRLPAGAANALADSRGAGKHTRRCRAHWDAFDCEPELLIGAHSQPLGDQAPPFQPSGEEFSKVRIQASPGPISHVCSATGSLQYNLRPLAAMAALEAGGFMVEVVGYEGVAIRHHLYQYVYNIGDAPVQFAWGDGNQAVLAAGDSVCCLPGVHHRFMRLPSAPKPELIVIRTRGGISHDVLDEFGALGAEARDRVVMERKRWF